MVRVAVGSRGVQFDVPGFTRSNVLPPIATNAANGAGAFIAGIASAQLAAANPLRSSLQIWNVDPVATVFGALGTAAALNTGFVLLPGGGPWSIPQDTGGAVFTGTVFVISTQANTNLAYVEV